MNTLILETPRGRFRLCKHCYATYEKRNLNKQYETTKKNIGLFGLDNTMDAYDIMKKKEIFIDKIKKGVDDR